MGDLHLDDDVCHAFRTPVRLVERELITRPRDETAAEVAERKKKGLPMPTVSYVISRAVRLDDNAEADG